MVSQAYSALSLLGTTVALVGVVALVGFLGFTLYIYYQHRKYAHIPGPPLDSFYFGNVPTLMKLFRKNEYFGPTFTAWAEEYGPVFRLFTLHHCMLFPTSPVILKEIMTKGKYPKYKWAYNNLGYIFGERYVGSGAVTNVNHAQWYKRRNVLQPAFHKKTLSKMMDKFNNVGDIWVDKLRMEADGETQISLFDYYNRAALASIVTVGFGMDIDAINDPSHPFTKAVGDVMKAAAETSFNPTAAWNPSMRTYRRDSIAQTKLLRRYSQECIDLRYQDMSEGREVPQDILTKIIDTASRTDGVTSVDLQDEFNTLFLAGQETTAGSLSFLTNLVGKHPEVLAQMKAEVDEVLGDRTEITWEDIGKLEYIHSVFKETLRLFPVAPATVRQVREETVLDGVRIPAGSPIVVDFFVSHHLRKNYEDPYEFRPERFHPSAEKPALYTYMPFSIGPRNCAGQHFATIEAKVLIAKLLQNFDFTLDPSQDFSARFSLTLKPNGGCQVVLSEREKLVD